MSYYLSHLQQIMNGADPSDFSTVGCLHRKLVSYRDKFGLLQQTPVNCGKCERCQDDRRAQWASRMWLHTLDSPWIYVYFVTLTYAPFDHNLYDAHPYLKDWRASYPCFDSYNEYGRPCWSPSVLCLSHIQKYIKRLRVLCADISPISYAYTGEYGSKWARSHWHLVVYSTRPIFDYMFNAAWGLEVCDTSDPRKVVAYRGQENVDHYHFSFGRVDVVDLVHNGTMFSKVDGSDPLHDAMHNFQYVAKYLGKSFRYFDEWVERSNEFYDGDVSHAGVDATNILLQRFVNAFASLDVSPTCVDSVSRLDRSDVTRVSRCLTVNNIYYENVTFETFCKLFTPVFHASTRYCLAKEYGLKNLSRFEKGNRSLPSWRGKGITFPSYFSYLIELQKTPLFFESSTFSSRSFTHSNFTIVRKYYELLSTNPTAISALSDDKELLRVLKYVPERQNFDFQGKSVKSWNIKHAANELPSVHNYCECVLKNATRSLRCILNWNEDVFECWEYDRGSRTRFNETLTDSDGTPLSFSRTAQNFHLVDVIPRSEFCELVISIIDITRERYDAAADSRQLTLDLFEVIESCPDTEKKRELWRSNRHSINSTYEVQHKDFV